MIVAARPKPAAAATAGLRGVVLDRRTGTPLPGAIVSTAEGRSATTDDRGRFLLTGLGAGSTRLRIEAPGYDLDERSTRLAPGTTEELVGPIREQGSGLVVGADVHLGYSPERIDPGNPTWGITNTPKVVGGIDAASTALAQTAGARKARLGFIYFPHGVVQNNTIFGPEVNGWQPDNDGPDFDLKSSLQPLEAFRDRLTVLSNIDNDPGRSGV